MNGRGRMGLCLGALCALALGAWADDMGRSVSPGRVGLSESRLGRIDTAMQRYIDRGEVAGTVTLVARKGRIAHIAAHGLRDAESQAPMTTDTIFRIASMTKPITSVALMMLYEEGHFLLSDPVSKFLPEFESAKVAVPSGAEYVAGPYYTVPAARPVAIRHILTHTAGLPNGYRGLTRSELAEISPRQSENETIGDFVTRLATLPLNFHPGEQWEYSRATDVVGRVVEVISGVSLDTFFRERIFKPLGMDDTHFYLPEEKLDRFAAQYTPDENGRITLADAPTAESRFVKEPHTYFMGAGGLVSTARDYFRFHQMMLNGGELDGVRILGRKTVELMTKNHTGDLPIWLVGDGYGFGLGYSVLLDGGAAGVPMSEGTYSWGGAFCTYFWVDPEEELIGILMTQVRPYAHLNIRQEFAVLANQAIVD